MSATVLDENWKEACKFIKVKGLTIP